jgi:hypothetical protein
MVKDLIPNIDDEKDQAQKAGQKQLSVVSDEIQREKIFPNDFHNDDVFDGDDDLKEK